MAQTFHLAFVVVKWVGVAYLAYLAWKMWTAPVGRAKAKCRARIRPAKLFFAGMAVTLGNPKIMMFYLALLPTIIDLASRDASSAGPSSRRPWRWCWSSSTSPGCFAAAQARKLLKSARAMQIANRVSAGTMAGAAAAIAARS